MKANQPAGSESKIRKVLSNYMDLQHLEANDLVNELMAAFNVQGEEKNINNDDFWFDIFNHRYPDEVSKILDDGWEELRDSGLDKPFVPPTPEEKGHLTREGFIHSFDPNESEEKGEIKPVFCPYCKTHNAYGYGDHTECNNCNRIWASEEKGDKG